MIYITTLSFLERIKQILGEELPALAKKVARVEKVLIYASEFLKHLLLHFEI